MGFKPGKGEIAETFKISDGSIKIKEQANAEADEAAFGQLWVKSNTPCDLFFTDDTGQDVRITNDGSLAGGGGGSLSGLGSTDNAVLRANGTGGETAQGSAATISDAGVVSGSSYTGFATRTEKVEVTSVSASSAQAATLSGSAVTIDNLTLGNTAVTSDAGELNLLDGSSAGSIANSKAVIYSSVGIVTGSSHKAFSAIATEGEFATSVSSSLHLGSMISASLTVTGGQHQGFRGDFALLSGSSVTVDNLALGNVAISADAASINLLDGAAAETIVNSKAVIYGDIGEVTGSTFKGFSVQSVSGEFLGVTSASVFIASNLSASTEVTGGWHRGFRLEGDNGIYGVLSGSTATVDNLTIKNTNRVTGSFLDYNYSDTDSAVITALEIDLDKTGNSTTGNTITGIKVDLDNSTATNGTNTMIGASLTPTLTHAANSGAPTVKGLEIVATGHSNGTSVCRGVDIVSTGADFCQGVFVTVDNGKGPAFKAVSSVDAGDFFSITVDANGVTTLKSVDDDNGSANMIMEADGNFKVDAKAIVKLDSETGDIHLLDNGATMLTFDFDSTSGSIGSDLIFKIEDDAKNLVFQQNDGAEVARIQHTGSLGGSWSSVAPGFNQKRQVIEVLADGSATTATLAASNSGCIVLATPINDDIVIVLPVGSPGIFFNIWLAEDVPSGKTVKIRTNGTDNNDNIYAYFTVPAGASGDEITFDFTGDVLTLQQNTPKGAWVKITNVIGGGNEIWHAEVISQTVALVDNS